MRPLVLLLMAVLAIPAYAGDADDFVLGVYRLERCGFMAGSDRAGADRVDLCRDLIDEVQGYFDAYAEAADPALADAVGTDWDTLVGVYEPALDDPYLFHDHYTIDDIRLSRTAITETLTEVLPAPPNPVALAVHIERMCAEYIWRAESTMGAGMSGTEILDIGQMVIETDEQFEVLQQKYPDDFGLQSAYAKYKFIRSSLLNYNVDMVPYLVDRYATSIVEALSGMQRN